MTCISKTPTEEAIAAAMTMIEMATVSEHEAFLVKWLIESLQQPVDRVDAIVQEFREMRGARTLWPEELGDD